MKQTLEDKLLDAIRGGDIHKSIEFINQGANINFYSNVSLSWAVIGNHFDIVKLLVKNGSNVHAFNYEALQLAKKKGYTEITQFLKLCMRDDKMAKNLVKILLRGV